MITSRQFGTLPDGRAVTCFRLSGGPGAFAEILDYGGTIRAIVVPDQEGKPTDVVLGYDDLEGYLNGTCFFGATVGRHANRIGNAAFTLNGTTYALAKNNGPNNLHGGPEGFDRKLFAGEIDGDSLHLRLTSPHMDQGFPGELRLTVTFRFSPENVLSIHYEAVCDRDTVANFTNHSYFDLSGGRNPMGQLLWLDAEQFCEGDENTLPTGRLLNVEGTPFDFRTAKTVGRDVAQEDPQLKLAGGYDHNYVLGNGGTMKEFARLRSPETGISMTAATDLPGVQVYSGNNILAEPGKGGRTYRARDAVCLETQFFPNALAVEGWEKPILRAGETFDRTTVYSFSR